MAMRQHTSGLANTLNIAHVEDIGCGKEWYEMDLSFNYDVMTSFLLYNPQGMVQAWVAHFVTPLKCTYDEYN